MDPSIAGYVATCLHLFQLVLQTSEAEGFSPLPSFNRDLKDEQTRFKVWSGNIGAQGTGASSLDYRLRESSNIRDQVVSLLGDLIELLQDAGDIISGDEVPWDQLGHDEGIIHSEDSEALGLSGTEMGQISIDVTDVVDCLLRLSVPIRDPVPHDLFIGSNSLDTSHYEEFDIQHVRSKFESIDSILAQRLGKAISRRRQFFKYRQKHPNRLSRGLHHDQGKNKAIAPSLPGHPIDIYGTSNPSSSDATGDGYSDTELSQTSYAASLPHVDQCRVPPLPEAASQGPFECPFCYMMIDVSDRRAWK
jgi:hypothetical protein